MAVVIWSGCSRFATNSTNVRFLSCMYLELKIWVKLHNCPKRAWCVSLMQILIGRGIKRSPTPTKGATQQLPKSGCTFLRFTPAGDLRGSHITIEWRLYSDRLDRVSEWRTGMVYNMRGPRLKNMCFLKIWNGGNGYPHKKTNVGRI